jgi:hypothetical protein
MVFMNRRAIQILSALSSGILGVAFWQIQPLVSVVAAASVGMAVSRLILGLELQAETERLRSVTKGWIEAEHGRCPEGTHLVTGDLIMTGQSVNEPVHIVTAGRATVSHCSFSASGYTRVDPYPV